MFEKNKFALILKNILETYNNQREFSKKSEINRTYLSQYMNMKLDKPPKPETLMKLAHASNCVTKYSELMKVCGYTHDWSKFNDTVDIEKLKADIKKYEELEKILGRPLTIEDVEFVKDIDVNGLSKEQKEDLKKQIEYMHWRNKNNK